MLVDTTIKAGNVLEIMQFRYHPIESTERNKKLKASDQKQIMRNLRASRRHCARLINQNFAGDGIWVGLDYSDENLPADDEAAMHELVKFLRRLRARRKRLGMTPLKYIANIESLGTRVHHHVILNRIEYTELKKLWTLGRVSYAEMDAYSDYISIANYITKEKKGKHKKKWIQSKNLLPPVITIDAAKRAGVVKIPRGYKELDRDLEAGDFGPGLYVRCMKIDHRGKKNAAAIGKNHRGDLEGREQGQNHRLRG